MCRTWTVLLVAVALVVVGAGAGGRSPAARVLEIKGKATIVEGEDFDRPAAVYGTVYADERLLVAPDSQVMLVFRGDGHIERVVARGTFKVTQNGCQPQTGVEQVALSERNKATVGKISKGSRGIVQGGVVLVRSALPPTNEGPSVEDEAAVVDLGRIRPIAGSTLLATKPKFSWPAIPKAKQYTLNLYFLGNRVWSASSEKTELDYAGDTPLKSGSMYSWEVTTTLDDKPMTVCEGMFHTISDRQRADAEAIEKLLAKPEPAYLALAAMWYKQNELVSEAIVVNEQLAKLVPDSAVYRELAELYFRAGCADEGNAAEEKMLELEKKAEGGGRKAER
jgi:hypothetical protein